MSRPWRHTKRAAGTPPSTPTLGIPLQGYLEWVKMGFGYEQRYNLIGHYDPLLRWFRLIDRFSVVIFFSLLFSILTTSLPHPYFWIYGIFDLCFSMPLVVSCGQNLAGQFVRCIERFNGIGKCMRRIFKEALCFDVYKIFNFVKWCLGFLRHAI